MAYISSVDNVSTEDYSRRLSYLNTKRAAAAGPAGAAGRLKKKK